MKLDKHIEHFRARPELLLALALSSPSTARSRTVKLEFGENGVLASAGEVVGPNLLATKETIFLGILSFIIIQRRPEVTDRLTNRLRRGIGRAGIKDYDLDYLHAFDGYLMQGQSKSMRSRDDSRIGHFMKTYFNALKPTPEELALAKEKTHGALCDLEKRGFIVDPLFSPEVIVLLGLVPMSFSVRTEKGDRIYAATAALWSLKVTDKTGNQDSNRRDIEFQFEGIAFVRRLIATTAKAFLAGEEKRRKADHQPVLPSTKATFFDEDDVD